MVTVRYPVLGGKKCLLTGASGGLGRAVARLLVSQGCEIMLTGRSDTALEALREELQGNGARQGGVHACAADLGSDEQLAALCARARERLGRVDILVNNAGVFPVAPLAACDLRDFDACFAVNVRAAFALCQAFAPEMAARGWGRIVNVGSSSSYAGFPNTSIYCASKHALLGLSRSLHAELKARNVRAYCVSPGSVQTDMGRRVVGQDYDTFIEPTEVAEYLAFVIAYDGNLVSDELRLNRMSVQ
jgi:NAD(P)-dependent dehydrogenase (short-subunit alcohol dehydrogenase family)